MKIKFRRSFKYTWDNVTDHEILPGEYEVPRNVDKKTAELALSFGAAVIVAEKPVKPRAKKKAPENKVVKVKEDK